MRLLGIGSLMIKKNSQVGMVLVLALVMLFLLSLYSLRSMQQVKLQSKQITAYDFHQQALFIAELAKYEAIEAIDAMSQSAIENMMVESPPSENTYQHVVNNDWWVEGGIMHRQIDTSDYKGNHLYYRIHYLGLYPNPRSSPVIRDGGRGKDHVKMRLFEIMVRGEVAKLYSRQLKILYLKK